MLGLAFAAIIYLVCLTGTIAVFAPDLQRLELPRAPVAAQLTPDAAARALGAAAKQVPGDVALNLTLPNPARSGARLIAFKGRFERNWAVAEDGGLTPLEAPWTEFLPYLHICLHLPRSWGGFLVGLTGVALLSSLVSGILAHPRVLRDAFHLRLGRSRRLQEADLHNRLGIWALPFHFTLALTGLSTLIVAVLALLLYRGDTGRVYALFLDPPPPVDARAAPLPAIAMLVPQAKARMGGVAVESIAIERPGRADMRISVHGRQPRPLVAQEEVQFDARGRRRGAAHRVGYRLGRGAVRSCSPSASRRYSVGGGCCFSRQAAGRCRSEHSRRQTTANIEFTTASRSIHPVPARLDVGVMESAATCLAVASRLVTARYTKNSHA